MIEAERFDQASQYIASFKGKMNEEEYHGLVRLFLEGMREQSPLNYAKYQRELIEE